MKLLLTSSGISNDKIADALRELTGKTPQDTKVGFVPTAANAEGGSKDWLINDLLRLRDTGYTWVDIVDPSAAGVDWRQRLADVDIVFIGGGNTFHLLDQLRQSGLGEWLKENAKDKVYVGSSAGSIVMTPTIATANGADPNLKGMTDLNALGLVDFDFIPHIPDIPLAAAERYAKTAERSLYALDDTSAIKVHGGSVEVVSQNFYRLFDK
jgi:dipeptidase E